MKYLILFLCIISFDCFAQNCSTCTQIISTTETGNLTVNVGDVLCISNTGVMSGTINLNGGTVCNEGTISGNISVNNGIFNNYGSISGVGQTIIHNIGDFNNEGTINNGSIITDGHSVTINNGGTIVTGNIDLDSTGFGPRPIFNNNGILEATNLTLANTDFTNDNSLTLSGNMVVGNMAYVLNDGFLQIGGNCNVISIDGFIRTNCVVQVTGNFANAGIINGPLTACGGFYVNGFASNSSTGKIGLDNSYIDICEQGNTNGLLNSGALGVNMTQCSCSNSCSTSTELYELTETPLVSLYPNPTNDVITLNSDFNFDKSDFLIYNSLGEVVLSGVIDGSTIQINSLKNGVYNISLTVDDQWIIRKIIKN